MTFFAPRYNGFLTHERVVDGDVIDSDGVNASASGEW